MQSGKQLTLAQPSNDDLSVSSASSESSGSSESSTSSSSDSGSSSSGASTTNTARVVGHIAIPAGTHTRYGEHEAIEEAQDVLDVPEDDTNFVFFDNMDHTIHTFNECTLMKNQQRI